MGKRSNFERIPNDAYDTPRGPVERLFEYWGCIGRSVYIEPCVGNGHLMEHIKAVAPGMHCAHSFDAETDARTYKLDRGADLFITNPPWTRSILHPIIENLSSQLPTWLLFDADWMHTRQAAPYLRDRCQTIISVGRVKWIPDSKFTGKDNCCWYEFTSKKMCDTIFIGR